MGRRRDRMPELLDKSGPDPSNAHCTYTTACLYCPDWGVKGSAATFRRYSSKRDGVLAEVGPFLHAIGATVLRRSVVNLVSNRMGRTTGAKSGSEMALAETIGPHLSTYVWSFSGRPLNVPRNRWIPTLAVLVGLLLSASTCIEDDFSQIYEYKYDYDDYDDDEPDYDEAGSIRLLPRQSSLPDILLGAVINEICRAERMIYELDPREGPDRDRLTQLDYMFCVFEVLVKAGASCHPCKHTGYHQKRGSLYLVCTAPWQCGPSSHSGRVFSWLLSRSSSLCPEFCDLEEATWRHSAWKVEQLLQLGGRNLEHDLGNVLFRALEQPAKSVEEEEMQIDIVQRLVQAGARLGRGVRSESHILSEGIRNRSGWELLRHLLDPSAEMPPSALLDLLGKQECSVEFLEWLTYNGADVNFQDFLGDTPLHKLLGGRVDRYFRGEETGPNYIAKLRWLIEEGADVNAKNMDDQTPLATYLFDVAVPDKDDLKPSVAVPDALVVQMLLDAGTDPNRGNCLHGLLCWEDPPPEVGRLLIRHGADVNKVDGYGETPLHVLCNCDSNPRAFPQIFGALLGSGADVNSKDRDGETPLHHACHRSPDGCRYGYICGYDRRDSTPMIVGLLVTAGADANAVDNSGSTPLHLAVTSQSGTHLAAIVDLLVAAGANVNATDGSGCAPLHLAALGGEPLAVERLIAAGADVKLLDPRGGNLLHYAACSPYAFPTPFPGAHTWVTSLDINARDHNGLSPLHWAARGSHNRSNLEAMLRAGADINARDHKGRTPLHHAARLATPRIAKRLISAGANAYLLDQQGDTPLAMAARAGSYEGVVQLLKAGVSAPETGIELGEPLALQIRRSWRSNIFSRLIRVVRFLREDPTTPSRARQQLQTTLLANLYDVYKDYPPRAIQEWQQRKALVVRLWWPILYFFDEGSDMKVRMLGQGGFGDAYFGIFFGRLVVSKQLRFHYEREKYMRHLLHEASIWGQLDHPNIIPLLGLPSIDGLPHLMSPLMHNGTVDDFVKKTPNVNRVHLLVQIAQGLEYMHTQNPPIIHGDLKANNILVSEDGSACLSDFGLSRVHVGHSSEVTLATDTQQTLAPITMAYHANFRWGAPEVLLDAMCRTPASDIYSLGRLMVELLTGEIPFPHLPDCAIIQHVEAGTYDRPPKDSDAAARGLDDDMWGLILECWDQDPLKRPSASQVVERLRRMPEPASVNPSWKPCVKAAGRGTTGDSGSSALIYSGATDSAAELSVNIGWLEYRAHAQGGLSILNQFDT